MRWQPVVGGPAPLSSRICSTFGAGLGECAGEDAILAGARGADKVGQELFEAGVCVGLGTWSQKQVQDPCQFLHDRLEAAGDISGH